MEGSNSNLKKPLLLGSSEEKGRSPAAAADALPVDLKKEASLLLMDIKKLIRAPPFQAVPFVLVNLWALISACVFGSFSAYDIFLGPNPSDKCSTCYYVLTDGSGEEANAMMYGAFWCSLIQGVAAVLALLLLPAGRGRHRLFTKAALAATAAVHCMHGRVQILLVADYPRDALAIAALLAVLIVLEFDVICFLFLKTVEHEEGTAKQKQQA